jgi:hypothetical protein
MRLLVAVAVLALVGCLPPTVVGRPVDWNAVKTFRPGETTPDDAVRVLGPPSVKMATGPDELVYSWSYYRHDIYSAEPATAENVFLKFRGGRLVDSIVPTPPAPAAGPTGAARTP